MMESNSSNFFMLTCSVSEILVFQIFPKVQKNLYFLKTFIEDESKILIRYMPY